MPMPRGPDVPAEKWECGLMGLPLRITTIKLLLSQVGSFLLQEIWFSSFQNDSSTLAFALPLRSQLGTVPHTSMGKVQSQLGLLHLSHLYLYSHPLIPPLLWPGLSGHHLHLYPPLAWLGSSSTLDVFAPTDSALPYTFHFFSRGYYW